MEGAYEVVKISADGSTFSVEVKGVKGGACTKLQDKFLQVGSQLRRELTDEYYEGDQTITQTNVQRRG